MAFKDWSTTAGDNDDADAAINWLEGQSPSTVNNSARAVMAALAAWRDLIGYGTVSAGTVGGTANAITLTCSPTVAARTAGRRYVFKYTSTGTTGGVTLVVDGLTSGAIQYLNAALVSGDIATSDVILVEDDGTNFQLLTPPRISPFKLVNGLTADASPDATADYWLTYDASASLPKKVLLNALIATQAEQETGTSVVRYVSPGRQHFHLRHPKAHLNYNVATPVVNESQGITSVDDDGTGLFGVNFSVTFGDALYTPSSWARTVTLNSGCVVTAASAGAKSTTAVDYQVRRIENDTAQDSTEVGVIWNGNLA